MPFFPTPENPGEGQPYDIPSFFEKMVAEYAGISMPEVDELAYLDFLQLRRDAYIYRLSQTKDGREYLRNAHDFEQTDADRSGLRELMKELGQS